MVAYLHKGILPSIENSNQEYINMNESRNTMLKGEASHGGERLSVRSRPCKLKSRHTPGAGSGGETSSQGKGVMNVSGMGILACCVLLLNLSAGHLDVFSLCYFTELTFCELVCTYLKTV